MSAEVAGLRPVAISEDPLQRLTDYRGFRDVVRSAYAHNFEADRLQKLVTGLPDVLAQVRAELEAFADFLEQQGL